MMKYTTTSDHNGVLNVTVYADGLIMIADRNHPRWEKITQKSQALLNDGHQFVVPEDQQQEFSNLFDLRHAVEAQFKLTDRVTLRGSVLYFDGNPIDSVLTNHVVRAINDGNDKSSYMPFIRFWERVQSNPSQHSRENLMRWLMSEEFTITDEGYIVGYKGVSAELRSLHSGPGVVNGKAENGHLSNQPGDVVEVVRSYVTFDPAVSCSQGLHVGTWKYASGFGPKVVEVWVDPADVVSVPTDSNGQKMRVCKYTVKKVLNEGYSLAILNTSSVVADDDEDEDENCPECGDYYCEGECEECPECGRSLDDCEC